MTWIKLNFTDRFFRIIAVASIILNIIMILARYVTDKDLIEKHKRDQEVERQYRLEENQEIAKRQQDHELLISEQEKHIEKEIFKISQQIHEVILEVDSMSNLYKQTVMGSEEFSKKVIGERDRHFATHYYTLAEMNKTRALLMEVLSELQGVSFTDSLLIYKYDLEFITIPQEYEYGRIKNLIYFKKEDELELKVDTLKD